MGDGDRAGKRLEMEAAKVGNYTLVVDDIEWWVARIECLCSVYFQHRYLMLPHCHLGVVVSQTGLTVEPYWLSSVEIHSSTSDVNKRW
jgi:hypothetical protein